MHTSTTRPTAPRPNTILRHEGAPRKSGPDDFPQAIGLHVVGRPLGTNPTLRDDASRRAQGAPSLGSRLQTLLAAIRVRGSEWGDTFLGSMSWQVRQDCPSIDAGGPSMQATFSTSGQIDQIIDVDNDMDREADGTERWMQTKARRLSKQGTGRTAGRIYAATLTADRAWRDSADGQRMVAERDRKRRREAARRRRRGSRMMPATQT